MTLFCKIDFPKVKLVSVVIVCKEIDASSIYQDLFNTQIFPINELAVHRVLGYTLQGIKADSN